MEAVEARKRRRVVLAPFPFQGHITPMLQLGSILHSKGFSIIIVHTEYNSPTPSKYPDFTFLPLPDNVSGCDTSVQNGLNVISAVNTNCKALFQNYMVQMLRDEELHGEISCIIYDALLQFIDPLAVQLKIPTILLRPSSAAYVNTIKTMLQLRAEKVIPLSECQMGIAIPDLYPLRFKDLPLRATTEIREPVAEFFQNYMDIKSTSAVILNSTDMLERASLQKLNHQHWRVPLFPIGPFHKMAPPLPTTSLMEEDTSCLSWLDKQAPNSVLYVSLGSLATMDKKELNQMAQGLVKSEQPFLWVLRPSLLNGSEEIECVLEDFIEMTRERGCIVKWAPQKKVLAHKSVGGFLSHCGWNSMMESISEGVPIICRPCFGDQIVNARYLVHVWRVGMELDEVVDESVANAVRKLMVSGEGEEMRQRVMDVKIKLEGSMKEGGSSLESLEDLVKFIISLSRSK